MCRPVEDRDSPRRLLQQPSIDSVLKAYRNTQKCCDANIMVCENCIPDPDTNIENEYFYKKVSGFEIWCFDGAIFYRKGGAWRYQGCWDEEGKKNFVFFETLQLCPGLGLNC